MRTCKHTGLLDSLHSIQEGECAEGDCKLSHSSEVTRVIFSHLSMRPLIWPDIIMHIREGTESFTACCRQQEKLQIGCLSQPDKPVCSGLLSLTLLWLKVTRACSPCCGACNADLARCYQRVLAAIAASWLARRQHRLLATSHCRLLHARPSSISRCRCHVAAKAYREAVTWLQQAPVLQEANQSHRT